MTTQNNRYAVLTGDIVGSSKLEPGQLKDVMDRLRKSVARFKQTYPDAILGNLDVYSGDSWQLLMPDWQRSLRAALYVRAVIKSIEKLKLDTRVALAWGDIDEATLNPDRISESTGPAFQASGRALEKMPKGVRMAFVQDNGDSQRFGELLSGAVLLLDEIVGGWSLNQAQAVSLALLCINQRDIGRELGVTQPNVQKTMQRARWHGVEQFLEVAEKAV